MPHAQMAPQAMAQEQGVFVQPPATGTVRGPVRQFGIEGLEIRFPELNLRLPSVRLPALSRSRQSARMELDEGHAPFVPTPSAMTSANMVSHTSANMMAAPAAMGMAPSMMAPMGMAAPQVMQQQMMQQPQANITIAQAPAAQVNEPSPETIARLRDMLQQMQNNPQPSENLPVPTPRYTPQPQSQTTPPQQNQNLQYELDCLRYQIRELQNTLQQCQPNARQPDCSITEPYTPPATSYYRQGTRPIQPKSERPLPPPDVNSRNNTNNSSGAIAPVVYKSETTPGNNNVIREPSTNYYGSGSTLTPMKVFQKK
jgi:hypothetical protein